MALAFQSGESIKQALYEELQNILNPNTEVRTSAESRLKQLTFTEGYGVYLAELIMNQSFDLSLRQLACVMLTKYVEEHWNVADSDISVIATDQAKRVIKTILPNGLYDPNSKIRTSVAYTISTIAAYDWPDTWTELFDIIVKCLGGNEDSIHGAMQVLVEFTYDLDTQIKEVGPIILSEVYRIFEAEQVYNVKTRTCAVTILTSLLQSINEHISSKDEQALILNPVLPNFITKLIAALSNSNRKESSFGLKHEVLRVLAFMVNEMPKFLHPYTEQILPPIWQLVTQTADIYVKVVVNESEPSPFSDVCEDDVVEELISFNLMVLEIIEFIHSIVDSRKFRSAVRNVLIDLLYIMIVYLQLTEEQLECWSDDPDKFVDAEYQEGVESSIRNASLTVLETIADEFGGKSLIALNEALTRHVNVAEAEKLAGNMFWWKIHEASMLAVGTFNNLISDTQDNFDLVQYINYARNLMNLDTWPYLQGRCLWLMSRCSSDESAYDNETLAQILDTMVHTLSPDKMLNLRLFTSQSIYGLCKNVRDTDEARCQLIVSKLNGFTEGVLNLMPQAKNSVLASLLQTIGVLISIDDSFTASVNGKIIPLTIAVFLKYHDDPHLFEHIQDIVMTLSQNQYCLQPLQEKFLPTLVSILNVQKTNNMQEPALGILQVIVKYSTPPLSEQLINVAFPSAVHCTLRTDDYTIMQAGGECLRVFISVSPEQVCSYKNGEGLNYIMQVATMLLNPMNAEYTAAFVGRLIITIIRKVGNMLGENIQLLLKAVISKMQLVEALSGIMSLIVTFAHLILTQMEPVLNFLTTVPGPTGEPAIQYVFNNWLTRHHLFYGEYERKVSTLALCKLLQYGVTSRDVRLTSLTIRESVENAAARTRTRSQTAAAALSNPTQWHTIPILVKIFKVLVNELASLRELTLSDVDTDDEDDTNEGDEGVEEDKNKSKSFTFADIRNIEEHDTENDELMHELMQDETFQANTEETLTNFFKNFSSDEHFYEFTQQLTDLEKGILQQIQINA